ncbi:MAG: peptidylprolyl isomerase, partial [Snowella sp.]
MTVILQINGQAIPEAELIPLLARYRLLPQLAREFIIDRAIAEIECTPEEVEQARTRFFQQEQIGSTEQLQVWLGQQGMTVQQLEVLMLRDLKVEKFKENTWNDKVESYFIQSKSK